MTTNNEYMQRLYNKVAIVTGGATGIGEAISKKFAKEGALVIVSGFPEDPVNEVVDEITKEGGKAVAFVADISIEENAKECSAFAKRMYDRLDILVNNAGTFPAMAETDQYPIDAFEYMLKNNIRSAFLMTRYALPLLQETRGCIISAGSESGELGLARNTPYGGTKGFMHAFTKGVAVEQAQYGVRANCVCPGPIDTAWTRKSEGPMNKEDEKTVISATPLGRRGTPEEVANVYLFLASDEASYVTGALYPVDGGITVSKGPIGKKAKSSVTKEPEGELDLEHSMEGATDMKRG
jgi:NAD(P)-dependent dehydrogenase (short-subunit alcohol dehydrogenase family)